LEQKNWTEAVEQVRIVSNTLDKLTAQIDAATRALKEQ
jgi:hypothetical protein